MTKLSRKAVAIVLLLTFSVLLIPQANAAMDVSAGDETSGIGRIALPVAAVAGVTAIGRWLTPLDEWEAEVRQLTSDETFVQRWMLLTNDPADFEKGQRALTQIQKKKQALEIRLTRLKRWVYPLITVSGAGAMLLTFWLRGD